MPNPEIYKAPVVNEAETHEVESSAETSRETFQKRGEMAKNARLAKLYEELEVEKANLAAVEAEQARRKAARGEVLPEGGYDEGKVGEGVPPVVPEETGEGAGEKKEEDDATATAEKAKKKKSVRNVLVAATAVVLAGILAAGVITDGFGGKKAEETPQKPQTVMTGEKAEDKEKIGIYDGYGERGMWLSETKTGPYNFADVREVAEVCDDDECEMIKYTAKNQVEAYADYLANLPEELQPEGFKGLSIVETERKLESLSDEEFGEIQKYFNDTIDGAFTRTVKLNGQYDNAYMSKKDPNGEAVHGNMQVVHCVTTESDLEAVQFYWLDKDGNEIGSMTVKMIPVRDAEGNILGYRGCNQVVNERGQKQVYDDLPEIEDPEDDDPTPPAPDPEPDPEPEPEPEPEAKPKPKDPDNLKRIDDKINDDIADDINTGEVVVTPTPTETVEERPVTPKPAGEVFEGAGPTTVKNKEADTAEKVYQSGEEAPAGATVISPENNYTENRGGANAGNAAANPVVPNEDARAKANASEIPVDEAPNSGGDEVADILAGLGTN